MSFSPPFSIRLSCFPDLLPLRRRFDAAYCFITSPLFADAMMLMMPLFRRHYAADMPFRQVDVACLQRRSRFNI